MKRCVECGKAIEGRKDKKTCSHKCRTALYRRLKGAKK